VIFEMAMFFFTFEAKPSVDHPENNAIGGAFVNCWIEASTQTDAEKNARRTIEEHKWNIEILAESYLDDRAYYDDDAPGLQYYEQALMDKEVFVFHRYPVEDQVNGESSGS
jgi:hypothetical protein